MILTTGYSLSVEWFLKKAYAGRQGFRVVITEAAPSYSVREFVFMSAY